MDSLKTRPNQKSRKIVDAVRHIGPTLESEEEQTYVPAREDRVSKEELAADSDLHVHRVETRSHKIRIIEEGKLGSEPEQLRTRLAGDTSSDPHTDVTPKIPNPINKRPKNAARNADST